MPNKINVLKDQRLRGLVCCRLLGSSLVCKCPVPFPRLTAIHLSFGRSIALPGPNMELSQNEIDELVVRRSPEELHPHTRTVSNCVHTVLVESVVPRPVERIEQLLPEAWPKHSQEGSIPCQYAVCRCLSNTDQIVHAPKESYDASPGSSTHSLLSLDN